MSLFFRILFRVFICVAAILIFVNWHSTKGASNPHRDAIYQMFKEDRSNFGNVQQRLPIQLDGGIQIRSLRLVQGYKSNMNFRKIYGEVIIPSDNAEVLNNAKDVVQSFVCSDHQFISILKHQYEFNPYALYYRSAYGARFSHIAFEFHLDGVLRPIHR